MKLGSGQVLCGQDESNLMMYKHLLSGILQNERASSLPWGRLLLSGNGSISTQQLSASGQLLTT